MHYKDLFEEVDKEEFLMYTNTPEKENLHYLEEYIIKYKILKTE